MKKTFLVFSLFLGILFFAVSNTYALSFMEGTRFLEAKTEGECKKLGWSFMEWYGEKYCTKAPFYSNFEDFIKADPTCKRATDGCNSAGIVNGELWPMTEMYCEDTYGSQGKQEWKCLDAEIEEETLGFMSENDRSHYKNLLSQLDQKTQDTVISLIENYGDKVLEKKSWNVGESLKIAENTLKAFDTALLKLTLSTPADAPMSTEDTAIYNILSYAQYELEIMMHRWMRNAGMEQ